MPIDAQIEQLEFHDDAALGRPTSRGRWSPPATPSRSTTRSGGSCRAAGPATCRARASARGRRSTRSAPPAGSRSLAHFAAAPSSRDADRGLQAIGAARPRGLLPRLRRRDRHRARGDRADARDCCPPGAGLPWRRRDVRRGACHHSGAARSRPTSCATALGRDGAHVDRHDRDRPHATPRACPCSTWLPPPRRRTGGRAAPRPRRRARRRVRPDDQALPRFHVWTLGCQMNRSDSEEMAGRLLAAGCAEAPALEAADLIVINTCAIREAAEQKVIGRMGHLARLKAQRPGTRVVMTGCSVREANRAGARAALPGGRPVPAARRGARADRPARPGGRPGADRRRHGRRDDASSHRHAVGVADHLPETRAAAVDGDLVRRESATHAWLPIIYGCDKTCTYCIVPFSRGPGAQPAVRRDRGRGAVARRRGLPRGHAARPERQLVRPRPAGRGPLRAHRDRALERPPAGPACPAGPGRAAARDRRLRTPTAAAIPRLRFVTSHPWDLSDRLIEAMAELRLGLRAPPPADPVRRRRGAAADGPPVHGRALPRAARADPRGGARASRSRPT